MTRHWLSEPCEMGREQCSADTVCEACGWSTQPHVADEAPAFPRGHVPLSVCPVIVYLDDGVDRAPIENGDDVTINWAFPVDHVPLSVRTGGRRKRANWWLKGKLERLAYRLAPWLRHGR